MSYIPRQVKLNRERIEAKLDRELVEQLALYCEYLDSDRDYVVSQALEIAFRKDKGFTEWIKTHPAKALAEEPEKARLRHSEES